VVRFGLSVARLTAVATEMTKRLRQRASVRAGAARWDTDAALPADKRPLRVADEPRRGSIERAGTSRPCPIVSAMRRNAIPSSPTACSRVLGTDHFAALFDTAPPLAA
jgi:hypothetical protein